MWIFFFKYNFFLKIIFNEKCFDQGKIIVFYFHDFLNEEIFIVSVSNNGILNIEVDIT